MSPAARDVEQLVRQSILAELAAMTLYMRLANRVEHDEPRRLLRMLAATEEGHIGRLTELLESLGGDASRALGKVGFINGLRHEAGRRLETQLAELGLSETSTAMELLQFAISMEARAGGQYQRLAAEAADPRLREFFGVLVQEEASHGEQLEHLRLMLEASSAPR
ncbi:MAG: ferritin family protein [Deltaproteobacteria bacterium]|nr:ferritin family protein [Deltaproteobacteria bacterium]